MSKRTQEVAEPKTCGFCAYVGPTLTGVIQKGTIFDGNKEDVLKALTNAIRICPLIPAMIVPGDQLAEAKINTKRPGNIMYVNYHKILSGKF